MAMVLDLFDTSPKFSNSIFITHHRQDSSHKFGNVKSYKSQLGPIPQYQYSKQEILELRNDPSSRTIPKSLDPRFYIRATGRWNPSLYFDAIRMEERCRNERTDTFNNGRQIFGQMRKNNEMENEDNDLKGTSVFNVNQDNDSQEDRWNNICNNRNSASLKRSLESQNNLRERRLASKRIKETSIDTPVACKVTFSGEGYKQCGSERNVLEMLRNAKVSTSAPTSDHEAKEKYLKQVELYLKRVILGEPKNEESCYNKLIRLLSDARSILPQSSISIGPWDKSKAVTEADIIRKLHPQQRMGKQTLNNRFSVNPNSNEERRSKRKMQPVESGNISSSNPSRIGNTHQLANSKDVANVAVYNCFRAPYEREIQKRPYHAQWEHPSSSKEVDSVLAPFTPTSVIRNVLLEKQNRLRTQSTSSEGDGGISNRQNVESSNSKSAGSIYRTAAPTKLNQRRYEQRNVPWKLPTNQSYGRPENALPLQSRNYFPNLQLSALQAMVRNQQFHYMRNMTPATRNQFVMTPPWNSSLFFPGTQNYYNQIQQILRWANCYRPNR